MKGFCFIPLLFLMLLSCGCSKTVILFTSEPSGAVVTYDKKFIGTTPLYYKIDTKFSEDNTYTFSAIKKGYKSETKAFTDEDWAFDVKKSLPGKVHFDLTPLPPEALEPEPDPEPEN